MQPPGSCHPGTSGFDPFDLEFGDESHQLDAGLVGVEDAEVARLVVGDSVVDGLEVDRESPFAVKLPQVGAGFVGVLGDEVSVFVVEQVRVFVLETECGGGLGGEDGVALADDVGQQADVSPRDLVSPFEVAGGDPGHPAGDLSGRDEQADLVMLQDFGEGAADVGVVIIRVMVHEIGDLQATVGGRLGPPPFRGIAEERFAGDSREFSGGGETEQPFEDPPRDAALDQRVGEPGDAGSERGDRFDASEQLVGDGETVGRDVLRLEFADDLGDVDRGGAFDPALVAIEAEVGDLFRSFFGERFDRDPSAEDTAEEVRLGSGRGLFAAGGAKHGALAFADGAGAAATAAVACPGDLADRGVPRPLLEDFELRDRVTAIACRSDHRGIGPDQRPIFETDFDRLVGRPQVFVGLLQHGPEVFSGVESVTGIEQPFDLSDRGPQRAVLSRHQVGSAEPGRVFDADLSAVPPHGFGDRVGELAEAFSVVRVGEVEERADVQLAVTGVGEQGRGRVVSLEGILNGGDQARKAVGGDADVFGKRERLLLSADAILTGDDAAAERPELVPSGLLGGRDRFGRALVSSGQVTADDLQAVDELVPRVPLNLDEQHRLGVAGDDRGELGLGFAGDLQQSPVDQVARDDAVAQGAEGGPGGGVEPAKEGDHDAPMFRDRFGAEGRVDHDRERPLRAHPELRQVDLTGVIHDVIESVAAAGRHRVVFGDERLGELLPDIFDATGESTRRVEFVFGPWAMFSEREQFPVGGDHADRFDRVSRRSAPQVVAARGVSRQHAAHRGDAAGRRVGAVSAVVTCQRVIQIGEDRPALDVYRFATPGDLDPTHVSREIEHDSGTEGLPGDAGARASRMEREAVFGGILDGRDDIGGRAGANDAERDQLIDAGVGRVELGRFRVAEDVTTDDPPQVVLHSLTFGVHPRYLHSPGPRWSTRPRRRMIA